MCVCPFVCPVMKETEAFYEFCNSITRKRRKAKFGVGVRLRKSKWSHWSADFQIRRQNPTEAVA